MDQQTHSLFQQIVNDSELLGEKYHDAEEISHISLVAYMVKMHNLQHSVQVNVDNGLMLLSIARAINNNNGETVIIGKDTSNAELLKQFGIQEACTLSSKSPMKDYRWLLLRKTPYDLLLIQSKHHVQKIVELLGSLIKLGGILVLKGTVEQDIPAFQEVIKSMNSTFDVVFQDNRFAILYKVCSGSNSKCPTDKILPKTVREHYRQCLPILYDNVIGLLANQRKNNTPKIWIGVLNPRTKEHLKWCLLSILRQSGLMNISICVFCATDDPNQLAPYLPLPKNMSIQYKQTGKSSLYWQVFHTFLDSNCEYMALIGGNESYSVPLHFKKHIEFLEVHPECAFTFNPCFSWLKEQGRSTKINSLAISEKKIYTIFDLLNEDFIGYWACSFIRKSAAALLCEEAIFCTGEHSWSTHLLLAQAGDIGYVPEAYTLLEQDSVLLKAHESTENILSVFNNYTNNRYIAYTAPAIQHHLHVHDPQLKKSLLIMDDVFPSRISSFRFAEFMYYLQNQKDMTILVNGFSIGSIQKESLADTVTAFKVQYPEFANQIHIWNGFDCRTADSYQLAYFCFLNNVYESLHYLEEKKLPFVFELYPGGGFALHNEESDKKLRAVLSSPCFRKVIVTQDVTHQYLLKEAFCKEDVILDIFGVVIPEESFKEIDPGFVDSIADAKHINICFAAMKYYKRGENKGYDIFIEVAKRLHQLSKNYRFTVVGNYDKSVIDVEELGKSIRFVGVLPPNELSNFFATQHIILSPNRADVLSGGAFDGFPTASCIEAGLQNTLIMCTDPKGSSHGRFISGENIEIITENVADIVQRIQSLAKDRNALIRLIRAQHKKIVSLYGPKTQLEPRLRLIQAEMEITEERRKTEISRISAAREVIPIMHCFDNNYVIPAAVSFYSMLENASADYDYKLYVLHTDITWQNQKKLNTLVSRFSNASLEFIDMSHRFANIWKGMVFSSHLSKEVLYKLITPSIFPQHEKLIVTDVDVVFMGDISQSYFSFDASDNIYLAGVKHIFPRGSFLEPFYKDDYPRNFGVNALDELKVCGGYLVMNLKKLREDQMEKVFLKYLKANTYRLLQAEQDVINFCCKKENIVSLPLNYVVCSYAYDVFTNEDQYATDMNYSPAEIKYALERPIQLHYATKIKPWNTPQSTMADKWFLYLGKTEFFKDYLDISLAKKSPYKTQFTPESLWSDYQPITPPVAVSVLCCTYNHSQFIRAALDGIVNQVTNAPFEIIISDDASTDDTQSIIREYQNKYPHLIKKCILREKNVGIGQNYYEALQLVEGLYLAICDGDDCWINPYKLQRQIDILNAHPDSTVCCSSFKIHHVGDDEKPDTIFRIDDYIKSTSILKDSYQFSDLLNSRFIASCTVMMRWKLHGRVPDFLKHYRIIDFPLSLIHSGFGKIQVMNDQVLAQYNVHDGGITSQRKVRQAEQEALLAIQEVNQLLAFRFTRDINDFTGKTKSIPLKIKEETFISNLVAPKPTLSIQNIPVRASWLKQMYHDWMPPVLKRGYRIVRYFVKLVYHECLPLVMQQFYTNRLKPRLKKP